MKKIFKWIKNLFMFQRITDDKWEFKPWVCITIGVIIVGALLVGLGFLSYWCYMTFPQRIIIV
jgi:hypothetical protein